MAAPTLRPASTISVSRLPVTGAVANVDSSENPLPFGSNVELKYPKFTFSYSRRVADGTIEAAGLGGLETIYSASFDTDAQQQDYDLQQIISENAALTASLPYSNTNLTAEYGTDRHIGERKIRIKKVFYKTPHAMWRFFGYYGGLNTVGNLSNYGQFADDSTFEIIPAWQNKMQALAFEDSIYTRLSHYSYEIKNNKLRLYPTPQTHSPSQFWVEFTVQTDPWEQDSDRTAGESGVNNLNTLPFANIRYDKINSIGKQWIRRFSLALCKEMLGQIRGKFTTIPIPGESVTLNASDLLSQAKEEQEKLREELKTVLDEMTYQRLAEADSAKATATERVMQSVPAPVFVG